MGLPGYVLRADNASPEKGEEKLFVENRDPLRYLDFTSPQEERKRNQFSWRKLDGREQKLCEVNTFSCLLKKSMKETIDER